MPGQNAHAASRRDPRRDSNNPCVFPSKGVRERRGVTRHATKFARRRLHGVQMLLACVLLSRDMGCGAQLLRLFLAMRWALCLFVVACASVVAVR